MSKPRNKPTETPAPSAPPSTAPETNSFGITLAAALAMSHDQRVNQIANIHAVRKATYRDQAKLIYAMQKEGLPQGTTVYGILRSAGVNEGSIQNAKRAADIFGKYYELVGETRLDQILTAQLCISITRAENTQATERIAAVLSGDNPTENLTCLSEHGKTVQELEAEIAATEGEKLRKQEQEQAAAAAASAKAQADQAAAAAAKAQADQAAAAAKQEQAAAASAKAQADQAAATAKQEQAAAAKEKTQADQATATAKAQADQAAAAAKTAKDEQAAAATAKAQADQAAAVAKAQADQAAAASAKAKDEQAAAAAAKAQADQAKAQVAAATAAAAKQLQSGRDAKLSTPDEILTRLQAAIIDCYNLPETHLPLAIKMLIDSAEMIKSDKLAAA